MEWSYKSFETLSGSNVYEILQLRVNVFVVEQKCAYQEVDGHDHASMHISCRDRKGIAAYARLLPAGVKYTEPSIGRVIVRKDLRGSGLADRLMENALSYILKEWAPKEVKLQAQQHLEGFYSRHGFETTSLPYVEDFIPHVDMIYRNTINKRF